MVYFMEHSIKAIHEKEQAAAGADVEQAVEKARASLWARSCLARMLGVIGLGAIGVLVANAAAALGMQIVGYDPSCPCSTP